MHHTICTIFCKTTQLITPAIKHANEVSLGQRNTFPLKLYALLLVNLTKRGVTGKPDKTSSIPKNWASLNLRFPGDTHHLGHLATPLPGSPIFWQFSVTWFSLRSSQPMDEMTKVSLQTGFNRNLRIIHAPGHFTQQLQNQCK